MAATTLATEVDLDKDSLAVAATYEDSSQTTITNSDLSSSNNSLSNAGAIYIYERGDVGWSQTAYLKAYNAGEADYFGRAVSLDDNLLAVSATG